MKIFGLIIGTLMILIGTAYCFGDLGLSEQKKGELLFFLPFTGLGIMIVSIAVLCVDKSSTNYSELDDE